MSKKIMSANKKYGKIETCEMKWYWILEELVCCVHRERQTAIKREYRCFCVAKMVLEV